MLHQLPDFLLPYLTQVWAPVPALSRMLPVREEVQWHVLALYGIDTKDLGTGAKTLAT